MWPWRDRNPGVRKRRLIFGSLEEMVFAAVRVADWVVMSTGMKVRVAVGLMVVRVVRIWSAEGWERPRR